MDRPDEPAAEEIGDVVRMQDHGFDQRRIATGGSTAHRKAFRRAQTDTSIR